jgi:hypothetical protein
VCSTAEERLALIGKAIDEVAAAAAAPGAKLDDLAPRLAQIWAMVAEIDPALAARLRGYTSARTDPSAPTADREGGKVETS